MYSALRKSLDNKNDKGFTLIELLVVIIIIGILAAIAIPIFLSQRKKGFEASQKSDARSVATQMETFYTDSQVYPNAADLVIAADRVTFGFDHDNDPLTAAQVDATSDFVVFSPNNSVYAWKSAGTGGFCIEVVSTSTDKTAVYDSAAGGLQGMVTNATNSATGDGSAGCDTATYPTVVMVPA